MTIVVVLMCGVIFSPQVVQGKLVTIQIEAVVDSVWDEGNYLEGRIEPGDIITGWYTYDTSTPDSNPSVTLGRYEHYSAPCGIFLNVGGLQFETDPANVDFLVEITNDYPPNDDYFLLSYNNVALPNGTPVDYICWHLYDLTGSALSNDGLPRVPPVLSDWQSNHLRLEADRMYSIDAYVTTAIPEPQAILLLGLGSVLLRKRR